MTVKMTAKMAAKIVTVFGGSGFVGRHTVRALAEAGYRVRVAVRNPHTAHFLRPLGVVGQVEIVQANIRDEASVTRALDGADAAVNLVGILFEKGKQTFQAVHVDAAARIARLAQESGVSHLVHLSAIGADPAAHAKYAQTKAEGEKQVRDAFPNAVVLRPSIIFGPEDNFFNLFASLARVLPFLPLIGGGHTRFQPVFVGDVADAVAASLAADQAAGRVFELGGPRMYSFKELLQFILTHTGRKRLLIPIPFALAKFEALVLALIPKFIMDPLLTMDQVELLKRDNVVNVSDDAIGTLADFAITPLSVESVVPSYLVPYRRQGQYEELAD